MGGQRLQKGAAALTALAAGFAMTVGTEQPAFASGETIAIGSGAQIRARILGSAGGVILHEESKDGEGKCGEGACGGGKKDKSEKKDDDQKSSEGKCGEGACGGGKK